MTDYSLEGLYGQLKMSLKDVIEKNGLSGNRMSVRCRVLDTVEAIGNPEDRDYPIQNGRESMVEAEICGARGQAFADSFENFDVPVEALVEWNIDTNARRAAFIASLNAVYRKCGLCEKTVHCRNEEPRECAGHLKELFSQGQKVALIGLQPRFLEQVALISEVRAVDLDQHNIGTKRAGVLIEGPEKTDEVIDWCDRIFATGSTIVNGSIVTFLNARKPTVFFGVTISAAAVILGLDIYCHAPVR